MHRAVVQILQVMATEGLRRSSLGTIPPRSPRASTCQCSFWCFLCDYHTMAKCLFFKFVFSHDSNWFGFPNPKLLWGPWLPCIAQPFLSLSPVYELPFLSLQPFQVSCRSMRVASLFLPWVFPYTVSLPGTTFSSFWFLAQDRPLGLSPLLLFNLVFSS